MPTPLTQKEYDWLVRIEKSVDKGWDELTNFEKTFVEDFLERFRRYGRNTLISPTQREVIERISEKIV